MSQPLPPLPTVVHVFGVSGTGKTNWLTALAQANPDAIQIVTPGRIGERFDPEMVDLEGHTAIAIDEVLHWDASTFVDGVTALEARAMASNRGLILISQSAEDLNSLGLHFNTPLLRIRFEGNASSLTYLSPATLQRWSNQELIAVPR